jgi:autotransporter-associated beta strand protein
LGTVVVRSVLAAFVLVLGSIPAFAQNAQWITTGSSGPFDGPLCATCFGNPANWAPRSVPTGVASFGAGATPVVEFQANTTVDSLSFLPGAPNYALGFRPATIVTVTLTNGVINLGTGGITWNLSSPDFLHCCSVYGNNVVFLGGTAANTHFTTSPGPNVAAPSSVTFRNGSTAGSAIFDNGLGTVSFNDNSTAGRANLGGGLTAVSFNDHTSAANATIVPGTSGFVASFSGNSTAGNARILVNASPSTLRFADNSSAGAASIDMTGGTVTFAGSATAGTATISAYGLLTFQDQSTAGNASITTTLQPGVAFRNSASAGNATIAGDAASQILFTDTTNAGTAKLTSSGALTFGGSANGGSATIGIGAQGTLGFQDTSSAGQASITSSGQVQFTNSASAGNATIVSTGFLGFGDTSSAGQASITTNANGVTNFSGHSSGSPTVTTNAGGRTNFFADSNARVIVNPGGVVQIGQPGGRQIGSIEGLGTVFVTDQASVGGNGLSTTFAGVLSQFSFVPPPTVLTKIGAGSLTLAGANTFSRDVIVADGTLNVTGSLPASVAVQAGAVLGGSGTIGNLANSGLVAPGSPGLALTVSGTISQFAGTYQVVVTPAGLSDRINVGRNATLSNGMVSVLAQPGAYTSRTSYTILHADGGISGTFGSVISNLASRRATLRYDANNVFLDLLDPSATSYAFAAAAQTPNQRAVGGSLDQAAPSAAGDFATVVNALGLLDANQTARALDALAGTQYAGIASVAVYGAQLFMNGVASQVGGGNSGANRVMLAEACDLACDGEAPRWGAWGGPVGGVGTFAGATAGAATPYALAGFAAGLDYRVDRLFTAGVAVGYTAGNQYPQLGGLGTSNTVQAALYGSYSKGGAHYLDGMIGYARGDFRQQRPILIPGLAPRTAQGQTSADQLFGQLETGYRWQFDLPAQPFVTPFVRLQGSMTNQAPFTESGADSLDLRVGQQTTSSLRSAVGAHFGAHFDLGVGSPIDATLRFAWLHDYADLSRPVTASFIGAPATPFTTQGAAAPRDGAILGIGASFRLAERTSVYGRYDGELQGDSVAHVFSAGMRVTW